ncbi:MAG TPA: MarR family transcriptional regulator [Marmoricola sp.]|jgi:DNA-binding MarR family transcriptional regulator|nr:MarR family transcriptional regulator [Marmoricola sp.]
MAASAQPRSDLGILVLLAYQGFVRQLHEDMARRGHDDLGRSDGVVFRILNGGPRTVSELASLLEISKQGTAQIIEDMERRGYVVRTPDPADARAKLVGLSERGRAALTVARDFHRQYERRLVREHGTEQVEAVRGLLAAMAAQAPDGLDRELRGLYL